MCHALSAQSKILKEALTNFVREARITGVGLTASLLRGLWRNVKPTNWKIAFLTRRDTGVPQDWVPKGIAGDTSAESSQDPDCVIRWNRLSLESFLAPDHQVPRGATDGLSPQSLTKEVPEVPRA